MKKIERYLAGITFIVLFALILCIGMPGQASAAEKNNPDQWERITRQGYGEYAETGGYYYYYTSSDDNSTFKIYRENVETGKKKCILKYKPKRLLTSSFYTNGKKIIYNDDVMGSKIYCKNADGSGKARTILNLSKSGDNFSNVYVYGNKLYYSTFHVYTMKYKTYRINITGKANKKQISGSYCVYSVINNSNDRYFPLENKNGNLAIYDCVSGKIRKLNTKGIEKIARNGNYWYYTVCTNPSASAPKFSVYRKKASGSGSAKKLASFSKKGVNQDCIQEITSNGIYLFLSDGSMRYYSFKSKKYKKTSRDVWYYISDNMKYM